MKETAKALKNKPKGLPEPERPVSKGRHEAQCCICAHLQREGIEQAFINWVSVARIAEEHSVSRDGIPQTSRHKRIGLEV